MIKRNKKGQFIRGCKWEQGSRKLSMLGKKHTPETIEKMRISAIKRGVPEENRQKMNEARKRKYKNSFSYPECIARNFQDNFCKYIFNEWLCKSVPER